MEIEHNKYVGDRIVEIKRKTKRKPAMLTIAIDDFLAEGIIEDELRDYFDSDFSVRAIRLSWVQKEKDQE